MSFNDIPAKGHPNDIFVAIEIPSNSTPVKYEIEKDYDAVFVIALWPLQCSILQIMGTFQIHCLTTATLDVLVVTPYPVQPGPVIRSRPIGILDMSDEEAAIQKSCSATR